jgi:hypothetical protein
LRRRRHSRRALPDATDFVLSALVRRRGQ